MNSLMFPALSVRALMSRCGRVRRFAPGLLVAAAGVLLAGQAQAVLPIEQWQTSNGVNVLFVRAADIPMLDIEVRFDAGDRLDPRGKTGLAGLTAALLDAGAGERDETAIADAFAMLGSQRSAWSTDDSASVGLRTLTAEPVLSESMDLLVDMISRPRFDEAVLAREKRRIELAIGIRQNLLKV